MFFKSGFILNVFLIAKIKMNRLRDDFIVWICV